MTLLHTILAFAFALGTLVVIHELGHYAVARLCGVKVLRFSVGMGRVVWSRRFGPDQTEWAVSILPLGGYVKMLDARDPEVGELSASDLKREFNAQSVYKRIAIVAAGPLANFILAILLFAGLYVHGVPEPSALVREPAAQTIAAGIGLKQGDRIVAVGAEPVRGWSDLHWQLVQLGLARKNAEITWERQENGAVRTYSGILGMQRFTAKEMEGDFLRELGLGLALPPAVLGDVLDGPGRRGGLQQGDRILLVNGQPVMDGMAFVEKVRASADMPLAILVERGGRELLLTVTPERAGPAGQEIGRIAVQVPMMPEMTTVSTSLPASLLRGVERTWDTSVLSVSMIGKMITGQASIKNITGPITIADYAGQTARSSWISYLSFIAFISISLGVMNLLPIPVLDGGHLLYYLVEIVTGKPVSERVGAFAQRIGMGLLLLLMLVAAFNDITRLLQ